MIDPDGTAYVDVARAWLQGDWHHALNSYWSPLYVWLVAAALAIFRPSVHWEIPVIHLVDLAGFFAAFAAWEWLTSEWESWQGQSAHPVLTDVVGYCVLAWAGLRLTGLGWFNSADVLVMALMLAAVALLVRVKRGVAINRDYFLLGIVLGVGFLAKTAFATIIPVFLVTLAILLGSWTDRKAILAGLTAFSIAIPFVIAISIANHRFTIGDSGRLNYSWHVTGMSMEGYKDSAYPPSGIAHPVRVLLQNPRVLSFEEHLVGTFPIHSDASWWGEGYPARFNRARELMIILSNIKFSVVAFARCPAILLIFICVPIGALTILRSFALAWFVWIPALAFAATYCLVFSDYRYLAGNYALIGFALVAAAWNLQLPRPLVFASAWAIPVITLLLMGASFRLLIPQFAGDLIGKRSPLEFFNVQIADRMLQLGLQAGDRVASIGAPLTAGHVGLERARIVGMVPARVAQDDKRRGRPMVFSFEQSDKFWRSSPQLQSHVFDAFQTVGAKWVFADCVPGWADTSGWQVAGGAQMFRSGDLPFVYYRRLR